MVKAYGGTQMREERPTVGGTVSHKLKTGAAVDNLRWRIHDFLTDTYGDSAVSLPNEGQKDSRWSKEFYHRDMEYTVTVGEDEELSVEVTQKPHKGRWQLSYEVETPELEEGYEIARYLSSEAANVPYSEADTGEGIGDIAEDVDAGWEDIVISDDAKKMVYDHIIGPLQKSEVYEAAGLEPAAGAVLEGPPGTGKTLLARVIAGETGSTFYSVRSTEIRDKYVGESAKRVEQLYEQARENQPAIIFFDEIDTLSPARGSDNQHSINDQIVTALLNELDGFDPLENVFTLGATNRVGELDNALMRPGRLSETVTVGVPDDDQKHDILQVHTRDGKFANDLDYDRILQELDDGVDESMTGADIKYVVDRARFNAIRGIDDPEDVLITQDDFEAGIEEYLEDEETGLDTGIAFQ